MKHRGLIILNAFYKNDSLFYKARRLKEELEKFSLSIDVKDTLELLPMSTGDKQFPSFLDYDFAIDLDKDCYLAKVISLQIPLINSYESMMLSDDKMKTILALKDSGINAPLTIPAPLSFGLSENSKEMNCFFDILEQNLGYPLVYKACHGSLGKQVLLIHNRKELEQVFKENQTIYHCYEKFLSKHQGHDYRVIVIGGKVIACMERRNENDFRSNIALGGKGYDVTDTLGKAYKDMAVKTCEVLGLAYGGIDIGTDENDEPIFIEANGNAFFSEIEKITHKNVAYEYAKYIYETYYGS